MPRCIINIRRPAQIEMVTESKKVTFFSLLPASSQDLYPHVVRNQQTKALASLNGDLLWLLQQGRERHRLVLEKKNAKVKVI